jgi:Zn-dependent peptidase ImmA (M78 family)/DNA-binding XRE family transcriptional regulator
MSRQFNPEMLVLARESRGKTQSEMARTLAISQGLLSRMEAGLTDVSDELVQKIVSTLKYPESFFYQTDQVYGYGSKCIYHRKRQSLPVSALRQLFAEINIIRIQIGRLLIGAEIEADNKFYRMDIADYHSPEHVAQILRRYWGIPAGPIENLVLAVEAAGGVVVPCNFGTSKLDALSQWPQGQVPLFFVNSESPTDRMRYTVAHELGHVIMHQAPTGDMEEEADRFAAEFLMPVRDIKPELRPLSLARLAALKPYWRVSMAALLKRADDLRVISSRQRQSLWTQMAKQGYRLSEPLTISEERPTVLTDIIDIYRQSHGFTVAEMSSLVSSFEHEFRRRFLPTPTPQHSLRVVKDERERAMV